MHYPDPDVQIVADAEAALMPERIAHDMFMDEVIGMATRTEMLTLGGQRRLGCIAVYGTHGLRSTRFAASATRTPDGRHTLATATFYDASQDPVPIETDTGDTVVCRAVVATRYAACEPAPGGAAGAGTDIDSLPIAPGLLVPSHMVPAVFGGDRPFTWLAPEAPEPDGVFRLRAIGLQRAIREGREYVTVRPDDPLFAQALPQQFISPWQRGPVQLGLLLELEPDANPALRFRRHIQGIRQYRTLSDRQSPPAAA